MRRKNTAINFIQNDLKALREKADRMEDMLEMLIDIYTDAVYVVKDEYVESSGKSSRKAGSRSSRIWKD
ncbi:MAG TPA: hypothetical protein VLB04_12025 [Methanotrichaceae archaeon]|nr:hypothetical protein [Methanotrichaceae archaeon]